MVQTVQETLRDLRPVGVNQEVEARDRPLHQLLGVGGQPDQDGEMFWNDPEQRLTNLTQVLTVHILLLTQTKLYLRFNNLLSDKFLRCRHPVNGGVDAETAGQC